jgi:hypothetical protein
MVIDDSICTSVRSSIDSTRSALSAMSPRSGPPRFVSTDGRLRLAPVPSSLNKFRPSKQAAPLQQAMVRRPRSPWIRTRSFIFNRRRRLSTDPSVAWCVPPILRRSVFNRCSTRSPIWLYAPLVPLRLFDGELVARRCSVAKAVFIWSKDLFVTLSSSEDPYVKLVA